MPSANGRAKLTDALPPAPPVPLLLDQERAWAFLGLSRSAWYRLKSAGGLPRAVTVPGAGTGPLWRASDLTKFVEKLRPAR